MAYDSIYLDFDGVICDSLPECMVSSYLALNPAVLTIGRVEEQVRALLSNGDLMSAFRQLRPFVRSGEDYLAIHARVQRPQGEVRLPLDQQGFDTLLETYGAEQLAQWKTQLYRVRDQLLAQHRDLWLSLNPLYPSMTELLARLAAMNHVSILSTKKAPYIAAILEYSGIPWRRDRIIYTDGRDKIAIIEEQLALGQKALLVDDQIDHLHFAHPSIDCRLASWGYIVPEDAGHRRSISLRGVPQLLALQTAEPTPDVEPGFIDFEP